jgi:putative addiction module CopG family antidote
MNITLTPEQSQFIQGQLATGNYQSPTEILRVAFDLLAEQENFLVLLLALVSLSDFYFQKATRTPKVMP